MPPRIVEVRRSVLAKNDALAARLRARFADAGVCVVSLVSSPGAGKTALLGETLRRLGDRTRAAALVGDLATDNDAVRLRASGAPVRQITTGTVCHLDAAMVERALEGWNLASFELLFIENVGNLVCPASYDLGEDLRVVLLSVTEGEDKPVKYPVIFHGADLALITKADLAEACGYNEALARRELGAVRPGLEVLRLSAKSGEGLPTWMARLDAALAEKRARRNAPAAPA
ncbi:MAG TPA: hydrogenase nickel incorporation protein HypB [bacterium]|nr:hydrogenase nickel incorporation protein HypB [bacterium]